MLISWYALAKAASGILRELSASAEPVCSRLRQADAERWLRRQHRAGRYRFVSGDVLRELARVLERR